MTAVAAEVGVSERTLWRWLTRSEQAPQEPAWRPSHEDLVTYALWCANASAAWRDRREAGADVPAMRTFQEGIAAALTPGQRAGLRSGERERREYDAYLRWEPEARNDLWEADHKQLDIDVRAQGFDRPVRPWLTLFVEAYSRLVPGWALSVTPHSGSILAAFGSAVAVTPSKAWGGVPVRLRVDRGADFLCDALKEACGRLRVVLDPAPPYSPFRKGQVEIAGKSVERALLPPLPGYLGAGRETCQERSELMTFDELVGILRTGIDTWNTSISIPCLAAPWLKHGPDATPIRTVSEERLRWMMLAEDRRTVQKEGVRFGGRYFTAAELTGRRGAAVRVLSWPHDQRHIEVMLGDEWLCTAFPQGTCRRSSAQRSWPNVGARSPKRTSSDGRPPDGPATGCPRRRRAPTPSPRRCSPRTTRQTSCPRPQARSVSLLGLETD